jgi:hypothetical protein
MTASRDVARIPSTGDEDRRLAPWTIIPSPAELATKQLSADNLARAVEGLDREGVVVIKGVVDPEHVRVVRERVLGDVEAYERDSTSVKIEQGGQGWWHNWQGGRPPPLQPYLFEDICYNEFAIAVAQVGYTSIRLYLCLGVGIQPPGKCCSR